MLFWRNKTDILGIKTCQRKQRGLGLTYYPTGKGDLIPSYIWSTDSFYHKVEAQLLKMSLIVVVMEMSWWKRIPLQMQ